jgi:small multidrug resistance family-3 protein
MPYVVTIALLVAAALLEASGDAFVRTGLQSPVPFDRVLRICGGALLLLLYACVVNSPPWDFGRVIGVYVVLFFLIAQVIAWVAFHHPPAPATWVGGALMTLGAIIISRG